jgi:hypothetical protein
VAKKLKTKTADFQSMVSVKFRTTPIRSTIKRVRGLPQSAILYKCPASAYWQFRVFLERKPRSTGRRVTVSIQCDNSAHARELLEMKYGRSNVINLRQIR